MTGRDLINEALEILGVLAAGETSSASDLATGLRSLNAMLGLWSADGLPIYFSTREVFPLVGGQAQYSMGPSGNFNTSRPVDIKRAAIKYTGQDLEVPIEILNLDDWAMITTKNTASSVPTKLYVETTFPTLTLNFWPVPNEVHSVVLYSDKPFAEISSLSAEVSLPPGYDIAVTHNLAKILAPKFGRAISAEALDTANKSLATIQIQNTKPLSMTSDIVSVLPSDHGFSILSGGS